MGKLDIGAPDNLNCLNYVVGVFLKTFLELTADCKHRRRAV